MTKNSEYMKKAKIRDLEDKDLQLRYFLGGFKIISKIVEAKVFYK